MDHNSTIVELTRSERDWLLKRVLDAISDVEMNPTEPNIDEPLLAFLCGMRDKMQARRDAE